MAIATSEVSRYENSVIFRDNFVTIMPLLHKKGTHIITTMTAVFIYVELTSKDNVQLFSSLLDNQI